MFTTARLVRRLHLDLCRVAGSTCRS
ncbi:putative leader peptide [Streptosporangium longisporum]